MIIEMLLGEANIDLKVKNAAGQTPFATALVRKNNDATRMILAKEPDAAEQVHII